MKVIFLLNLFLIITISCKEKQNYYHGTVFDQNQKPLSGVKVTDSLQSSISNEKGYFKLNKNPNIVSKLSFSKSGYKTRTIETVGSQSGEILEYRFLNEKPDTLFLKRIEK